MTFPFTPHTTYTDDTTPAINADFLMAMQKQGVNPQAISAYFNTRPYLRASYRADGSNTITVSDFYFSAIDSATSKWTYANVTGQALSVSILDTGALSWPASKWVYLYGKITNGVGSVVASEKAPMSDLTVQNDGGRVETLRFLGVAFWVNSGNNIAPFTTSAFGDCQYVGRRFSGSLINWDTAGLSHDVRELKPPEAQYVVVELFAYAGGTGYQLSLSAIGDPFDQILETVNSNSNVNVTHRIAMNGQNYLVSDVDNMTSATGVIRVIGFIL